LEVFGFIGVLVYCLLSDIGKMTNRILRYKVCFVTF